MAVGIAGLSANPAQAQSRAALEAQRAEVFDRLFAAPSDRALMMDYARLSIALRDFETAAATLERLLDLEPGNAEARLDLAIVWYAMGNYPVADYHLAAATASGGLSAAQLAEAEAYRRAGAAQDAPSRLSGSLALGAIHTGGDTGALVTGTLDWRIDTGDANATEWVTQMGLSSFDIDADTGDTDRRQFRLRTGPELRISGLANGPTLQPYLQVDITRAPGDAAAERDAAHVGLAYQNPVSPVATVFADVSAGAGEYRQSGEEITYRAASLGISLTPGASARYRLTGSWSDEDATSLSERRHGLRADYSREFEGFNGRGWRAGAFAAIDWRDITQGATTRDLTQTSAGLSLRAGLSDGLFVEARGAHVRRTEAGAPGSDETILSMQLGWEF